MSDAMTAVAVAPTLPAWAKRSESGTADATGCPAGAGVRADAAPVPNTVEARCNRLLASLSPVDQHRWSAWLEPVVLPVGTVLHESGRALSHVYFPTTAIISLLYLTEDGASVELSIVGRDGLVGVATLMGGDSTPSRAVVRSAGMAYRVPAAWIKSEFDAAGDVMHLLLRYTQSFITQMAQTAACGRHHSIEQRLSRWLLMNLDLLIGDDLRVTQEMIASMLGVRREGITASASELQRIGAMHYARGRITVLDRAKLEARCCECYSVVRREQDRLLPKPRAVASR